MTTRPGAESELPLVALLGRAHDRFSNEVDARLRASEFCALSLAHSRNVLRHLWDGPRRASQVVTACDVTKQAVSQQIAHLERNGYLATSPDPSDQRARLLSLTDKGRAAQQFMARTLRQIEEEWRADLGADQTDALRQMLSLISRGAGPC